MTFERSAFGQANRAMFYNVDWIIYTEGGAEGGDPIRSFDALFWSGVFHTVCAPAKFRAIPRGGKGQLLPLAQRVVSGELDRVIVAMDRDYDHIFGRIIEHSRVVYTCGYSFENDVFNRSVLFDLFDAMCPEMLERPDIERQISDWCDRFLKNIRWPLKADILACHYRVSGFDRDKSQKYFESNAYGSEPVVSRDRVYAEVVRISTEVRKGNRVPIGLLRFEIEDVFGHFWEVFAYRVMSCLHSRHSRCPKPTFEGMRSLAIKDFQVRLLCDKDATTVWEYYRNIAVAAVA